ncbi:MAG: hypothetical protein B7Z08_02430 [Sphingomonadales bacterium 32-68-7]|nr:MAG: hypothetical protein B7Z33_02950 [Sphingomonadales bacterium 12-68-11]OYX10097.1 MAG: hypothetical protein B7Z08_02430 [Sphingomonadales bacterium 32-68-7]
MASNFKGNWMYTPPEGDLAIVNVYIPTAADASEATTKAWEKLGEDPEQSPRLANPLPDTKGWKEWVAANRTVVFDEKQILLGMAFRRGTAWMVLIARASGYSPNSLRLPPVIMVNPKPAPASGR